MPQAMVKNYLANLHSNRSAECWQSSKAKRPEKKLVSVSTGKAVDTDQDAKDQRKKFALHRENASTIPVETSIFGQN